MKTVSQGKIFLADQRKLVESDKMQGFNTFNFGGFFNSSKVAFDKLYLLNDESLGAKQKNTYQLDRDSHLAIIPITGATNFNNGDDFDEDIEVEECLVSFIRKGQEFSIINPFDAETINYLALAMEAGENGDLRTRITRFDLTQENELIRINHPSNPFSLKLGRFGGRQEAICHLGYGAKFFAFNISGAFEIDGRLLHERDGLALWDTDEIELEALSENAVILTLEIH